jgi:hypothetical protein
MHSELERDMVVPLRAAVSDDVVERPIDVDPRAGLFGILTHSSHAARTTGFIIVNSGLLHRVGPFRLYVEIARRIADSGFPSIRLDQSGKGDSDSRPGVSLAAAATADVSAAAACLARETGVTRFVVGGLCSGADDALLVGSAIVGLSGLFMFDGYAPRTARYYLERFGPKLFSARAWLRRARVTVADVEGGNAVNLRNWGPRAQMIARYRALLGQQVRILAIFTSQANHSYNFVSQLSTTVGRSYARDLLTEHYYPEATHLFPVTEHRRNAVNGFANWAERFFD